MNYTLKVLVLAKTPDIAIDKPRFESLKRARNALTEAFAIEEKYELLLSNLLELQDEQLSIASRYMLRGNVEYSDFFEMRLSLNRRIVNLLTSTRLYIDHLGGHVRVLSSNGTDISTTVARYISDEYDTSFEYRLMEALRNHVQHRGLVVHSAPIGGKWTGDSESKQLEYGFNAFVHKDTLSDNEKFKKSVLEEMPEKVNLIHAIKCYVGSLTKIHAKVRELIDRTVVDSRGTIQGAIDEYAEVNDGKSIGLSAIRHEGPISANSIAERVPLLLDWDDVRLRLAKRNKKVPNLGLRYVSGITYNNSLHRTSR